VTIRNIYVIGKRRAGPVAANGADVDDVMGNFEALGTSTGKVQHCETEKLAKYLVVFERSVMPLLVNYALCFARQLILSATEIRPIPPPVDGVSVRR